MIRAECEYVDVLEFLSGNHFMVSTSPSIGFFGPGPTEELPRPTSGCEAVVQCDSRGLETDVLTLTD